MMTAALTLKSAHDLASFAAILSIAGKAWRVTAIRNHWGSGPQVQIVYQV